MIKTIETIGSDKYEVTKNEKGDVVSRIIANPKPLSIAKSERIARIKCEAAQRISALDWQVTRAKERDLLAGGSNTNLLVVLKKRDAIRLASTAAELAVGKLRSTSKIESFKW